MPEWVKVVYGAECHEECEMCGEIICPVCDVHYFECKCPGPNQDELFDYKEIDGVLYASSRG